MFRSTTIIRELVLSLAKVISKHSVKYVVICYVVVWQHAAVHKYILCKNIDFLEVKLGGK
jgi:hypothetical protein